MVGTYDLISSPRESFGRLLVRDRGEGVVHGKSYWKSNELHEYRTNLSTRENHRITRNCTNHVLRILLYDI